MAGALPYDRAVLISGSATSVSWIPSEAVTGVTKASFTAGVTHYDDPPVDRSGTIDDLDRAGAEDRFRFANRISAWAEVSDDGKIVDAGFADDSRGVMGGTTLRLGPLSTRLAAISLPHQREQMAGTDTRVSFRQTYGGRPAMPFPRRVSYPPYVQVRGPLVWTTLELDLHADGRVVHRLAGASPFPRHWVYDTDGALDQKSGLADFAEWARTSFGEHSPWGGQDSPAFVSAVETALEREVADVIMRGGARPEIRTLERGETLTRQGDPAAELYLVLDGVLTAVVDDQELGLLGPGSVLGERGLIEGRRTATLTAETAVRVAVAPSEAVEFDALHAISEGHRREDGLLEWDTGEVRGS
jgi:hypothetical protein